MVSMGLIITLQHSCCEHSFVWTNYSIGTFQSENITAKEILNQSLNISVFSPLHSHTGAGQCFSAWKLNGDIIISLCRNPRKHYDSLSQCRPTTVPFHHLTSTSTTVLFLYQKKTQPLLNFPLSCCCDLL